MTRHKKGKESSSTRAKIPPDKRPKRTNKDPKPHRSPIFRFVLIFALTTVILYALTATGYFERHGWIPYLNLNASISGAILDVFGEDVTIVNRKIVSARASIQIERGCDAIHPTILFVAAALALPASWRARALGIVIGTGILMVTNLFRIITLFYVQKHWRSAFDVMHVEVWQALFIFFAIVLWFVWANWALGSPPEPTHDTR